MARLKKNKSVVREKSELDQKAEVFMLDHGFDSYSLNQIAELFDYELPSAKPLDSYPPHKAKGKSK